MAIFFHPLSHIFLVFKNNGILYQFEQRDGFVRDRLNMGGDQSINDGR